MKRQRSFQWSRLDNAAKIFPPSSTPRDPKVFRITCELNEDVQPEPLQKALDQTLQQFPLYCSALKKGLFWYYLEATRKKPDVQPESLPPCSMLYRGEGRDPLFRVVFYRRRINLEVYHALSDGTGALNFTRVLVYHYLLLVHAEEFGSSLPQIDYDASRVQQMDDSFRKYCEGGCKRPPSPSARAFHLRGECWPDHELAIVEGVLPLPQLLAAAKARGTTLTVFLTAVLMQAIHSQMSMRDCRRPVVVSVPVNLRNYFPSATARNFFSVVNVQYDFGSCSNTLEDIIEKIHADLKENLNEERLGQRINQLASLEDIMLLRVIPLFIKIPILKFSHWMAEQQVTAAFSNLGQVQMPQELHPYVRLFGAFLSTRRMQACMASFEDRFLITFTTPFVSTEVQKNFFRVLTDLGIEAEITVNQTEEEGMS